MRRLPACIPAHTHAAHLLRLEPSAALVLFCELFREVGEVSGVLLHLGRPLLDPTELLAPLGEPVARLSKCRLQLALLMSARIVSEGTAMACLVANGARHIVCGNHAVPASAERRDVRMRLASDRAAALSPPC